MRKEISIFIFFLCFGNIAKTQNLVPNGGFEIYSQCPNSISQINYAVGWMNAAVATTPDYQNSCSSPSSVGVPHNSFGYQQDCCGGEGYAGIYCFSIYGNPNNGREYIEIKLNDTLLANKKYIARMYVNRSNNFDYSLSSLGMYFSNSLTQALSGSSFINVNEQVKNNFLLSDTLNWILVEDTVVNTVNKFYLTIGNFSYDSLSDTTKTGGNGTFFGQSYYYIDGVSVYDVTDGSCNNYWDAGFNKYILAGDSIRLGAINTDNSTYIWQNSTGGTTYLSNDTDARPWSTPSVTTTYYVTKKCPNNNVFIDTVTVYVQSTAGIKQLSSQKVQVTVYPNPNNGNFSVNYNLKEEAVLEVLDIVGNLISTYSLKYTENKIEIGSNKLENGIYFIRVETGKDSYTQKIIVQH